MKKILKTILPAILMVVLIYLMRDGKDILNGLFVVFPIMYIYIGIISSDLIKEWLISMVLMAVAFIIPIDIWFHMGSCTYLILIYTALSCASYLLKIIVKKKLKRKKNHGKQTRI